MTMKHARHPLSTLDKSDNGLAIPWVKSGNLDHIPDAIPPQAIWGCRHDFIVLSELNLPLRSSVDSFISMEHSQAV